MADVERLAVVVCDAGPLIHLDELGCLDLLSSFREVLVPDAVCNEVLRHRPQALRRRRVRLKRVTVGSKPTGPLSQWCEMFSLAAGEREALLLMADLSDAMLLTDDDGARLVAEKLGYEVHGTIGIIAGAIKKNSAPNARSSTCCARFRGEARCTSPTYC